MSFSDPDGSKARGAVSAFLLSIAGSAAFTAVGTVVVMITGSGNFYFGFAFVAFLFSFLTAFIVIFGSAVIIGLPLTWILSQSRLEQPWTYPLAGFATGALIVVAIGLSGDRSNGVSAAIVPFTLVGALPGLMCGAIWWFAYRRHKQRPELDVAVFD